ncbi:Repressor ROX1-like protein [Hirschfeldia incana]|nr:Repressor ROX1-like protein [Hirschfeldia incana]
MSFRSDRIDDETSFLWSPEYIFESPELCLPLRPQNHQNQTLHRQQQQQQGISHESWLRGYLLNVRSRVRLCFFCQPMLSYVQDPSLFPMNRIGMGQRIGQGNRIAHPTLSYSHEFPNHLQEIQQVSSDAFGSLFPQHFYRFSDDNLPVITTNITETSLNRQQYCLCAHTLSTREPLLNNQYHNYYDLNQIVAVNTEHSSPIGPSNFTPNGLHNNMPYQTYVPITSDFTINGQQLPPSVLAIPHNEAHNLRAVNHSARHHVIMQRRVHQSSSSFQVTSSYTQLRRRPSANSSIPPQNEVLGSRRRTYESRFQFGEPSSSTRRRRNVPAGGSVGSTAINPTEERREYGLYDPEYERQGLCIDPHLRCFLNQ